MKKAILTGCVLLFSILLTGQQKESAEKLVNEGIALHDKGDYSGAISLYDKALELDKDNLLALTEKSISLISLEKFTEAMICCQQAIEKHPGENGLRLIYVNYGTALDGLKTTDKALEVYEEGIRQFPQHYLLHFNKGITLYNIKKSDEAILCFQKAVILNPGHAGSHNAIAILLNIADQRIPSLLVYCRFLTLESISNRAQRNLASVEKIMKGNTKQTGEKSITINIIRIDI